MRLGRSGNGFPLRTGMVPRYGGRVVTESSYDLVTLRNGARSLHSTFYGETLHPGTGPRLEAEALYVRQLNLPARLAAAHEPFVIWDVGLGAAANAAAVLRSGRDIAGSLHLISFDSTTGPLVAALDHAAVLDYLDGYEAPCRQLLLSSQIEFPNGRQSVRWQFEGGDFPQVLRGHRISNLPRPHAILFDPFSPARNPAMWTLAVFQSLWTALDPARPCALATYSRSTMLRTTLLLAGFFVGQGQATGMKEETTVAANSLDLIERPLGPDWLRRAQRSGSAEPLTLARYRQAPLSADSFEKLKRHPQFEASPS